MQETCKSTQTQMAQKPGTLSVTQSATCEFQVHNIWHNTERTRHTWQIHATFRVMARKICKGMYSCRHVSRE